MEMGMESIVNEAARNFTMDINELGRTAHTINAGNGRIQLTPPSSTDGRIGEPS